MIRLFMIFFVFVYALQPAFACRMKTQLSRAQLTDADAVLYANPVQFFPSQGLSNDQIPARIVYHVTSVIRGSFNTGDEIEVYWLNGTFGESSDLDDFKSTYGAHQRIGLIMPETYLGWCRMVRSSKGGVISETELCAGPFNARPSENFPNRPWIMNAGCSDSFIYAEDE